MRRRLIAAAAALLAGCASASPPPGGPEDHAPPQLVRVTPDTNAVNVDEKVVSFYFDETINDRGSGPTEIASYFLLSPTDGNTRVSWHRRRIDVRPHRGFRPNTAYTITLLPGLTDLRNNPMKTGATVVFSTGPSIPTGRLAGTAFDWAAEKPAARALVQAITPDSVVYLAQADSAGRFTIGPLPPGSYLLRAVIDANNNRALDRNEAFDTLRVTAPQTGSAELLAIVRDTLPPRITTVAVADSLSLRVGFDRPLDQRAIPGADAFRLVGPDSVAIPIGGVLTPRQEADSARRAAEVRADSARRADSAARKAPATPAAPVRPVGPSRAATVAATLPRPSLPAPPTSLLLRLPHPLVPNTLYRLRVTDARALSGRATTSERSFTTPKPPPPPAARPAAGPAATTTPPPSTSRPTPPSRP